MISRLHNALAFLLAMTAASGIAQVHDPESRQNLPFSFEAIPFYSADTSTSLVYLHYRINQRYFIFVRNPEDPEGFIAKGELMIELRSEQDIAVTREIRQIRILRKSLPAEKEQLSDVQGAVVFHIPEGKYTVIFSLDDRESGRSHLDRDTRVVTKKAKLDPLELSYPMVARIQQQGHNESITRFFPMNRGTNVIFGGRGGMLHQVYLPDNRPLRVHWKIQRQRGPLVEWFETFSGDQYAMMNGLLRLENIEGEVSYTVQPAASPAWKLLYIPLPIEKLDPGGYTIDMEISSDQIKSSKEYTVQVLWLNRPAALLNAQLAIDALRHITSEDELAKMQTGSLERNIKAFYEYWKTKDPDTTTAYNEVMVEYYRRVDEAVQRYSTLSGQDGYKTDRGRIIILYGSPTRTEKYVPPGEAPTEVWSYDRLKRRFVFSDKYKTGNYILIAAENL